MAEKWDNPLFRHFSGKKCRKSRSRKSAFPKKPYFYQNNRFLIGKVSIFPNSFGGLRVKKCRKRPKSGFWARFCPKSGIWGSKSSHLCGFFKKVERREISKWPFFHYEISRSFEVFGKLVFSVPGAQNRILGVRNRILGDSRRVFMSPGSKNMWLRSKN